MIKVQQLEEKGGCNLCKDNYLNFQKPYYRIDSEEMGHKVGFCICKKCLDDINRQIGKAR